MDLELAIAHTIKALREGSAGAYGYDLFPTTLARNVAEQELRSNPDHYATSS